MNAIPFDTLKFARALRDKAKLSPEQAEGFADAMSEAIQGDLGTKADLQGVKTELQADIKGVRMEIRETELRLEARIEATKADLIKWMFGTIGFQTILILGAVIALARVARP